ncbi:MAG: acylphosphatase, partial [Erysipelotrichaceae bacterium]|nr:acylphosphatase [Erysipelotrichaceae bacterium]
MTRKASFASSSLSFVIITVNIRISSVSILSESHFHEKEFCGIMKEMKRYLIIYSGIVQGVGFRYTLAMTAKKYGLTG